MLGAIMDCSVLRNLYYINNLDSLQRLYSRVLLPAAVRAEFLNPTNKEEESKRLQFLLDFEGRHARWFRQCTLGDKGAIEIYRSGLGDAARHLHLGETEAMAQYPSASQQGLFSLLIDERKGRIVAKTQGIPCNGTLHILARLDLQFNLLAYQDCCDILVANGQRFSDSVRKQAYEDVQAYILNLNR
jgi:predicted nucleic acid-binding protein